VLQEGVLHRVGGEDPVTVDVRVIAATHRPLEQMVADGSFRADLFYRLDVFPLHLPPLRERQGDLPALAAALLQRLARRLGRPPLRPSHELLQQLAEHVWPGNVRELENVLERALILAPDDADELAAPAAATRPLRGGRRGERSGSSTTPLHEAIRSTLKEALDAAGGRIYGPGGAAERLGLPPTTLQSKLRRFDLVRRRR
jgi:transcriptional regulator with GAF, ATPase, and Fis domain